MIKIRILNDFVCQNDILHVYITVLDSVYFDLLTTQVIGILDSKEGEIKFLESIPVVLKVKNTLSKDILISLYLPNDVLPSYKSENYEIQYFFVMHSMNKMYSKTKFWVHKTCNEHTKYTNVKIIEQDHYYVHENAKDIAGQRVATMIKNECKKVNSTATACKLTATMLHDYIEKNNKEEMLRQMFYNTCNKIKIQTQDRQQMLQQIDKEMQDMDLIKYKYRNNIAKLLQKNTFVNSKKDKTYYVKHNEDIQNEITIADTYHTNTNNKLEIQYKTNAKATRIAIKRIETKAELSINCEHTIFDKQYNTDKCKRKVFDIFLTSMECYTIDCFCFATRFTMTITLDDNEIELPVKIDMQRKR